jgi:hypothetical protein
MGTTNHEGQEIGRARRFAFPRVKVGLVSILPTDLPPPQENLVFLKYSNFCTSVPSCISTVGTALSQTFGRRVYLVEWCLGRVKKFAFSHQLSKVTKARFQKPSWSTRPQVDYAGKTPNPTGIC